MTIRYEEDDATRTATITVSGKVTEEDYRAAVEPMQKFIDKHGKVRFIEVIETFRGFDPSVIWPGMKFDWKNLPHITHVAVVSDLGWIGPLSKTAGYFMSTKLRTFGLDELEEARKWVQEDDA
ncbi:STAS/SEC14 domain-containing protein [Rhodobacteraceae bacterium 63075]|nr:STAS/SEC14 domain-containing protein [Rhodobacteraceae bacterium 63075]